MLRVNRWLMLGLCVMLFAGSAYADGTNVDTTGEIPVSAEMGSVLAFSWELYQQSGDTFSWAAPKGNSSMQFGQLVLNSDYGTFAAPVWYALVLYTSANIPYNIVQSCPGLTTTGGDLNTSFVATPDYHSEDRWDPLDADSEQGGMGLDLIASKSLATGLGTVYMGREGVGHIIRIYYALPHASLNPADDPSGFDPITIGQTEGIYSGTVTVSITP